MTKCGLLDDALLQSHSVYLREIEEEDVTNGIWHKWYNDYKLTAYNSHGVYPINIEDERQYFRSSKGDRSKISFAICAVETGRVIGSVSLLNIDLLHRKADVACTIGSNISPTAGLESIGLIVQHGMSRLNLNKISGGAHEGLGQWVKMMACLGFVWEGRLRQESLRNGKYSDTIVFGLLYEDYSRFMLDRNGNYLFETSGELYKSALSQLKIK
jgi:diamine N-acetyltransferase